MRSTQRTFIDRAIVFLAITAVLLLSAAFVVFYLTRRSPETTALNSEHGQSAMTVLDGTNLSTLQPTVSSIPTTPDLTETALFTAASTADTETTENKAAVGTTRPRNPDSIIPDGPTFAEISPDGKIDYSRISYDSLVAESEPVPDSYFEDALFIGNSIQQIQRQIGSIRADYITTGDHNVFRYFEWDLSMPDGQKMTTAVWLASHRYGKIYLTFGINEVSYDDQEPVWQGFRNMLADVLQKQPGADVYLVGLLPVYPPLMNDAARRLITPEKILEFNHKLAILAEDEGVYMLNPAEALQDENGYLNPEWSQDGVHFGKAATDLWDQYTRTHTVP